MSETRQRLERGEQYDRLRGAVRGLVTSVSDGLTTAEVSDLLSVPREAADDLLTDLAAEGVVAGVDGDETGHWQATAAPVRVTEDSNSVKVQDPETGIVSRAETRPVALRRLADRLEQYAEGETIGAQIRGISETTLSPAYAQGVGELVEEYVAPADKHLYVYVPDEGIREITRQEQLHRDHTVAGFAVTGRFTRAEFDDAMSVTAEGLLAEASLDVDFPLSVFKLVAVHPDYQGQGIGTSLVTHGTAYLADQPPVVAMIWERESDANIAIAEDYGAERLAEFENTSPSKWKCPECGFGTRCTCKSAFYAWGLE